MDDAEIGFELLGWKSQPAALETNTSGRLSTKGDCVVRFPTNGVDFGHLPVCLRLPKG